MSVNRGTYPTEHRVKLGSRCQKPRELTTPALGRVARTRRGGINFPQGRTAEITQRTRDSQNTRQDHSTTQITQSVALQNISLLRFWSKWRSSSLPRPPARIEARCQIRRRSPRRGLPE